MKGPMPDILLMTADTIGGVWTYALELTGALQPYGIHVYLATMGRKLSAGQWESTRSLTNLTVRESAFDLEWMADPWNSVDESGRWLLGLERQIQPDLIHLNTFCHGNLPWKAPVLMAGHSCVLSWWNAVRGRDIPDNLDTYRIRVKAGLRKADCVIGVSGYMLDQLKQNYGPFSSSDVIYNARKKDLFYSAEKKPVILSMGRIWDEGKNMMSLKDISPDLSWPVYIAGETRSQAAVSGNNLHFLGRLNNEEVAGWLSIAGIYVLPARYEPFGLSVLEAALSGCALVLGDIPSLREIWGDAALFADPEDRDAFADRIEKLANDDRYRTRMAEKAAMRAQRYQRGQMARLYADHYRLLLQNHSGQSLHRSHDPHLNSNQK
ncbi:MAG: glycosyltransferase family 4 protein [Balneolaceae bacterium]